MDVAQLVVNSNRVEVRKRVPDARRLGVLRHPLAPNGVAVRAVGLVAVLDVVPPADAVPVKAAKAAKRKLYP